MLNSIDKDSIKKIVLKGFEYLKKNYGEKILDNDALELISELSNGDARYCLNAIENSYFASDKKIEKTTVEELLQKSSIRYSIDSHYDYASAFIYGTLHLLLQFCIYGSDVYNVHCTFFLFPF